MRAEAAASELMAGVRACAESIASRAADAEREARLPAETVAELSALKLFRVFQPARFGGLELHMRSVLPIIAELARSCPSTAWVSAVYQIHQWLLGHFPEQAQDEIFGDDPAQQVAGVLQPRTTAKRIDGGYGLSGASWPYGSGCDHCSWFLLGGLLVERGGPPDVTIFVVPRDDVGLADDWQVAGLRGTGSKTLIAGDLFVPEHRAIRFADLIDGKTAAGRSALYQAAPVPMLCLNVTGPALGAARAAIDFFQQHIAGRSLPFSQAKQVESAQAHLVLGKAMLEVDSAELLLREGAGLVREAAVAGEHMDIPARNRVRAYASAAVRQCIEAVNQLFLVSGGSASQQANPLQQWHRDVHAMAQHAALLHENNLELWGAAVLDQPLNSVFI
jgi:alkylation response protein AidB-like acyl-CoA dehydrogenase